MSCCSVARRYTKLKTELSAAKEKNTRAAAQVSIHAIEHAHMAATWARRQAAADRSEKAALSAELRSVAAELTFLRENKFGD